MRLFRLVVYGSFFRARLGASGPSCRRESAPDESSSPASNPSARIAVVAIRTNPYVDSSYDTTRSARWSSVSPPVERV